MKRSAIRTGASADSGVDVVIDSPHEPVDDQDATKASPERDQAALAWREGCARGMARDGARGVSRRGVFGAARGDTEIATPGAIAWRSASWALAGGRGGGDRRGGSGSPCAQRGPT